MEPIYAGFENVASYWSEERRMIGLWSCFFFNVQSAHVRFIFRTIAFPAHRFMIKSDFGRQLTSRAVVRFEAAHNESEKSSGRSFSWCRRVLALRNHRIGHSHWVALRKNAAGMMETLWTQLLTKLTIIIIFLFFGFCFRCAFHLNHGPNDVCLLSLLCVEH